jgi:hypothetical protein
MQQYKCISILLFFHGWFAQVQNQAILAELDLSLMCWPSTIGPPQESSTFPISEVLVGGPIHPTHLLHHCHVPAIGGQASRGWARSLQCVKEENASDERECLICTIRWRLIFDSVMHFTVQNGQCIAQCLTTWALTV